MNDPSPQRSFQPFNQERNMSGVTVTEKEHWKNRIALRIDKRIEAIYAAEPNLDDRVQREARDRALASLGLAESHLQSPDSRVARRSGRWSDN